MNANHELALYYRPTCPFCIKVLDFMDRQGVMIPLIDISQDRDAAATLIEVGGNSRCPVCSSTASRFMNPATSSPGSTSIFADSSNTIR